MKAFIATLVFLNLMVFSVYHYYSDKLIKPNATQITVEYIDPTIMLISERQVLANVVITEAVAEPVHSVPPLEERCYLIEGLKKDTSVLLFSRLEESDIVYSSESYTEDEISNYWVYIPQLPSLSEARALHDKIRSLGVKDVYVIEAGRNKNKISLGLYRRLGPAEEIVTWFSSKNIDVKITKRYKKKTYFRVTIGPLDVNNDDVLSKLIASEFNSLKYQNNSCK